MLDLMRYCYGEKEKMERRCRKVLGRILGP